MKRVLLSLMLVVSAAAALAGCTAQQLATAKTDLGKAQSAYAATTQAVDAAQTQLDKVAGELDAAKATLATQPANATEAKIVAELDTLAKDAEAGVAKAKSAETQAQAVLTTAQNVVGSLQTQNAPDVSALAAFGSYGQLAGLIITAAFGVWQFAKNQPLVTDLASKTALLDHVQAATGTSSHLAAVTAAVAQVAPPAPANPAIVLADGSPASGQKTS